MQSVIPAVAELLMMVPPGCMALCLLFPSSLGRPRRGEQKEKKASQPSGRVPGTTAREPTEA